MSQVKRGSLGHRDRQGQRARKVRKAFPGLRDHRAQKDRKDRRALPDLKATKAIRATPGLRDHRVQKDRKDRRALPDQKATKGMPTRGRSLSAIWISRAVLPPPNANAYFRISYAGSGRGKAADQFHLGQGLAFEQH
jgi:hypothetical protein